LLNQRAGKPAPGVRIPLSPQILISVFMFMWEYNRITIEFKMVTELLDELNKHGASGWEIISYEEKKPKKFGGKFESIVLFKKEKSCTKETQ
jgi:hypothetical protein